MAREAAGPYHRGVRALEFGPATGARAELLLVPGANLCAEFYAPLGEALARRGVRTVALTLPGFHGMLPLPEPTFEAYVGAILGAFAERLLTGGDGVDGIVDSLSGDAIPRGLAVLRPGGRFIEIGAAGLVETPGVDPRRLFEKGQSFVAANAARLDRSPTLLNRFLNRLIELFEAGTIRPAIGHRPGFADAPAAHELLRAHRNVGKIVLGTG
jgi:hypothetical protein